MFYLLFSLIFAAIAVLFALNGMRKGKKYIWGYSVARTVVVIVSAILSAFLSAGISLLLFDLASTVVLRGNMAGLLNDLPITTEAIRAIAAMIVAPILYYVIFFVLRLVLGLIVKIVLRAITKSIAKKKAKASEESKEALAAEADAVLADAVPADTEVEPVAEEASMLSEEDKEATEATEEMKEMAEDEPDGAKKKQKKPKKSKEDGYFRISAKKNPWGRLCGALCGVVLFMATMIPAVGMIRIVNDIVSLSMSGSQHPVASAVVSVMDAGANNAGSKAIRAVGGDALYSVMTTYEVDGEKASLAKETRFLGVVGRAMADMTNPEMDRVAAANSVREIDEAFQDTSLIPAALPEFLNASKESWDNGEKYYGIAKPSLGKVDGLVHPILDVFATSTKQTLDEDVATLVDLMAYMVEKDAMTNVKEDPMSIFKKQEVTAEVLYQLLENDHLAPLVGEFSKFGLESFGEALGSPMTEVSADSSEIRDPRKEAEALAIALSEMAVTTEKLKENKTHDLSSLAAMGPMLDAFAATETVGKENTDKMMESILTSPKMAAATKLEQSVSQEWAASINEQATVMGYEATLESFCATIAAMQAAAQGGVSQ